MSGSVTNFRGTLADRLRARIVYPFDGSEDCWIWTGRLNDSGYGVIAAPRANGVHVGPRMAKAHRVSYELLRGPIPEGLTLDHLCRNRWCQNPDHLEPVTRGENVRRGAAPSAVAHREKLCLRGHPKPTSGKCRSCRDEVIAARRAADKRTTYQCSCGRSFAGGVSYTNHWRISVSRWGHERSAHLLVSRAAA